MERNTFLAIIVTFICTGIVATFVCDRVCKSRYEAGVEYGRQMATGTLSDPPINSLYETEVVGRLPGDGKFYKLRGVANRSGKVLRYGTRYYMDGNLLHEAELK